MTGGFEPRISGVLRLRSTNCATTTSPGKPILLHNHFAKISQQSLHLLFRLKRGVQKFQA